MKDPKEVLTREGFIQYQVHLYNLENALFFLLNHQADLEIDHDDLESLYATQSTVENLKPDGQG